MVPFIFKIRNVVNNRLAKFKISYNCSDLFYKKKYNETSLTETL